MARSLRTIVLIGSLCLFAAASGVRADENTAANNDQFKGQPLSLSNSAVPQDSQQSTGGSSGSTSGSTTTSSDSGNGFMGVGEVFQIREANPNVRAQQWELLTTGIWNTRSQNGPDDNGRRHRGYWRRGGGDQRGLDEVRAGVSLKYGITDDLSLGVEVVPILLGQGGDQGAGDISILYHWRIIKEDSSMPAIAQWGRMRIPTGDGSSGVDGEFHATLTKTIADKTRAHLDGFVMAANGEPGEYSDDRRDHFKWGIGPGFDYQFADNLLGVLNYLHRNSEFEGNHNNNILEMGTHWQIDTANSLRFMVDVGLDGGDDTPNLGAKLQWGLAW